MMDQYQDTTEQSMCRQRTEEEQRAVEMCTFARVLLGAGAQEVLVHPAISPHAYNVLKG